MTAKLTGLKASKDNISQTIDLEDLFGVSFAGRPVLREAIGQAIIDRIIDRTEEGKSVNGGNLKSPYSGKYADSDEFALYGKNKNEVNMTLTGNMLNDLDIVDQTTSTITIGFNDEVNQKKAANHHQGVTVPKRPFFGVSKKDLEAIKKEFKSELDESEDEGESFGTSAQALGGLSARDAFFNLFGDLFDGES